MLKDEIRRHYESICEKIHSVCSASGRSSEQVTVVAVTKVHPIETVQAVLDAQITQIGENRVQEIEQKAPHLRGEFTLHLVGPLQTNKINKVLPYVSWIQSIDRRKLVDGIEKRIEASSQPINALVQVNTSGEPSKSGCSPRECSELCEYVAASASLDLRGLMTIGPLSGGERETRAAFALLRNCSERIRHLVPNPHLSMGMSNDFEWAVAEGATMVRIGSSLVGSRYA
ncbi:MAG: YggS family pyridoxal phosphate-dependent enzyme [Chitinivibrionales bacterium]|nr:YggS family pyridoxal phosphate-dependent enzyme [Chitinivibrionales bacterium]